MAIAPDFLPGALLFTIFLECVGLLSSNFVLNKLIPNVVDMPDKPIWTVRDLP